MMDKHPKEAGGGPIGVVLVDDHGVVREGLRPLLTMHADPEHARGLLAAEDRR